VRRFLILGFLVVSGVFAAAATVWASTSPVAARPHHPRPAVHHRRRHSARTRHHRRRHRHRRHVHHRKHKRPTHRGTARPAAPAPTPPAVPTVSNIGKIQHVVWILMENENFGSIVGSGSAPYINSLASTYGLATAYSAISHPSLPNYIALTSGSDQGIADDSDPSSHLLNVPSIFSQLPNGASRSIEQNMPSNCAKGDSGDYAVRHDPETYYTNLGTDCSNYDVPLGAVPDLSARFTFVTPNLINDMHDGTIADGDNFLNTFVPAVMATPQYQVGSAVIFITWDENSGSSGNQVPCIVISPFTHAVKDATPYTHYSLLRTTEELLGLPLLGNAASATSMLGKFGF
jgi:phosphatidylinositol-3-phosphatase